MTATGEFWDIIANIIKAIGAFLNWYFHDTPLFKDTCDAVYEWVIRTYNVCMPLIREYIDYITAYIHG